MKAKYLGICLVLVLVVCSLSQAATKFLEWKYDGNLNDNSGNGYTGVAYVNSGAPAFSYGTGMSGQAMISDGNQCCYKNDFDANFAPFKAADHWTVNAWVYPTVSPAGNWKILWNIGIKPNGDSTADSRCLYATATGMICFNDGGSSNYLSTGIPFDVGQWQMITTIYDGNNVRIYKNGLLIGKKAFTFVNALGQIRTPSNAWYGNTFIAGKYDEFTIWNEALTQQEVIDLIPPGILPEGTTLDDIAYYTLDDPCDSLMTMPDHSGYSNTALLYGYTSPAGNWVVAGPKGGSLLFNGGQSVDLPTGVSVSQYAQHSVAFWFKSGYQPFNSAFYSEKSPISGNGSILMIRGDAGTTGVIKAYSSQQYYSSQYSLTYDASAYMDGKTWHHLAVTADGDQAKMYLDGELVQTVLESNLGGKTSMDSSIGFNLDPSAYHFLGEWDKTYVDDLHIFKGTLTQEEVQALASMSNVDNDVDVDFIDFAAIADEWFDNTTSVAGTTLLVDDMESTLAKWSIVDSSVIPPNYYTGTGTISATTNAYAGSKAMQWNYSLPAKSGGNYSSIMYNFGTDKNLTSYDAMKIALYRHAGNPPEGASGLCYVKFYDSSSTPVLKAELQINGPNSVVLPADQWEVWTPSLNVKLHLGTGYVDKTVLTNIRYIVIGCGSEIETARTGAIDFDEIKFVKYPVCSPYLIGDIDSLECKDCKVDFKDLAVFVEDWLLGAD